MILEPIIYGISPYDCVIETHCFGNGQLHDAMSPSKEVCKTLNCMDDPMKIVIQKEHCYPSATDYKFPQQQQIDQEKYVIEEMNMDKQEYIVRRLTPLECNRLQGFPDYWGEIDPKEDFTDEEYAFWLDVRNTYAEINGKQTKEYTKEQMLTWYNKLHTDSAEYKMWGNGIGLPNALYVMEGIVDNADKE